MRIAFTLLAAAAVAGCAATPPPDPDQETIPFVRSSGILEWEAAGPESLYVRGANGRWYLVRTMGPCRLNTAQGLRFQTSAGDQLDRHGAIVAEGFRCPVESIVASEGPPREKKS